MEIVGFLGEERGVSPIIGLMLAIAIFVSFMGMLQAHAVPQWNREIELDHADAVRNNFYELKKSVEYASSTDFSRTSSIDMGTRYPNRMLLFNPGPGTSGTLRLSQDKWIYVSYTDSETGKNREENLSACTITYTPSYNYTPSQQFVYEHGIVFKMYSNYSHTEAQQNLTDEKHVNLLVVGCTQESVSTAGVLTVNLTPVSSPEGSVLAENLTIKMKTEFPSWWTSSLDGVEGIDVSDNDNVVTASFDNKMILKMGKVHASLTERRIQRAPPTQLVKISGDESAVPAGSPTELVAEVRDNFNNPVSQIEVDFEVSGAEVDPENVTTGADGRASTTLTTSRNVDVTAYTPNYENIDNIVFHIQTFKTQSSTVTENAENAPLVGNIVIYLERSITAPGKAAVTAEIDNAKKWNIQADLTNITGDGTDHSMLPTKFDINKDGETYVTYEDAPDNVLRDVIAIWDNITHRAYSNSDEITYLSIMAYNAGMQFTKLLITEANESEKYVNNFPY